MSEHEQHVCTEDCQIMLAVGVCEGCGYSKDTCDRAKDAGYLKCCPDCKHPTEDELRALRRSGDST